MEQVASKSLPGGTWVLNGYAWLAGSNFGGTAPVAGATCELRDAANNPLGHSDTFFTGTFFQGNGPSGPFTFWAGDTTLNFNAAYTVPAGGATVSLWCSVHGPASGYVEHAQVTGIQVATPLI
jgi:hypothetical protein